MFSPASRMQTEGQLSAERFARRRSRLRLNIKCCTFLDTGLPPGEDARAMTRTWRSSTRWGHNCRAARGTVGGQLDRPCWKRIIL